MPDYYIAFNIFSLLFCNLYFSKLLEIFPCQLPVLCINAIFYPRKFKTSLYQSCFFQFSHMLRNCWVGQRDLFWDFIETAVVTRCKMPQDGYPGRMRQCLGKSCKQYVFLWILTFKRRSHYMCTDNFKSWMHTGNTLHDAINMTW